MSSRRGLGDDEYVIADMRTHPKALIWPVLFLFLLAAGFGAAMAIAPHNLRPWIEWAIELIAVILLVFFVLRPVLRWATTNYLITTRRVIMRTGIVKRVGHDVPLNRVVDVSYERSLTDRLWGCGTVRLMTMSEMPIVLPDVPKVDKVHRVLSELLFVQVEAPQYY